MYACLSCNAVYTDGQTCLKCGFSPSMQEGLAVYAPELAELNDDYSADFYSHLAALEAGHFWFQSRNSLIGYFSKRYFLNPQQLIKIGCGTGFVLTELRALYPNARLHGTDIFVQGLHFARQRIPEAVFFQMDARSIPFVEHFDLIGTFDVIEHIEEDQRALEQMYRALKPGGGLLITVPQHQFLWSQIDAISHHKRRYEKADLLEKIANAGFRILYTTSYVSLLLPVMLITRMRKASTDDAIDLYAEFKLSPWLNRLLTLIMRLEILILRAGIRFRYGGSRLVVAYRPT